MPSIDLKAFRAQAGLSQAEVGKRLDLSQAQISRYEDHPQNVPFGLMMRWMRALGVDLASLSEEASPPPASGINPGQPYTRLWRDLSLLQDFARTAPDGIEELPEGTPTVRELLDLVEVLGRKPNVSAAGPFDGGKSTIHNALLGIDGLPTSYQPATRVVTFVRHIKDRPAWLKEDVWMLGEGFNPLLWDNKEHCSKHKVVAGSLETLKDYGTHEGRHAGNSKVHHALVFLDAPILQACNLLDLPGFDNDSEDTRRAKANPVQADVMIYACPYNAFMRGTDQTRLGQVVRDLPTFEQLDSGFSALGNLFVVATHASPSVGEAKLTSLLDVAARRTHQNLGESVLRNRGDRIGRPIGQDDLRSRFFPFYLETPERRARFEATMSALLTTHLPQVWRRRVDREILAFRSKAKKELAAQVDAYQRMLGDLDQAEKDLGKLREQEPERRRQMEQRREQVEHQIGQYKSEALQALWKTYMALTDVDKVERLIRQQFPDRKEAQTYAPSFLFERLQHEMEQTTADLSERLSQDVQHYLDGYNQAQLSLGGDREAVAVPFNAEGAFVGGLAGAATVGALAAWAASLGNLGAYIIAAKAVSLLAALGIGIPGGTAAVMAFIAAVGGPVTVAAGIVALAAMAGWALFGSSWQSRLAKKIVATFHEKKVHDQLKEGLEAYWDGTLEAFQQGADEVERQWEASIEDLYQMLSKSAVTKDEVTMRLERFQTAQDFFAGIPWKVEPSQ